MGKTFAVRGRRGGAEGRQGTSSTVCGMTPALDRISGAIMPAAPSIAHRAWMTSLHARPQAGSVVIVMKRSTRSKQLSTATLLPRHGSQIPAWAAKIIFLLGLLRALHAAVTGYVHGVPGI